EQVLVNVEVALFDLLLRVLDALRDPRVLDGLVVGHAHALHQILHAVAREAAHEAVLERQIELAHARIASASVAAAELAVDARRRVALGADDVEAAQRLTLELRERVDDGLAVLALHDADLLGLLVLLPAHPVLDRRVVGVLEHADLVALLLALDGELLDELLE